MSREEDMEVWFYSITVFSFVEFRFNNKSKNSGSKTYAFARSSFVQIASREQGINLVNGV